MPAIGWEQSTCRKSPRGTEEDGEPVVYHREPGNEPWRELKVDLLSLLPIDSQL